MPEELKVQAYRIDQDDWDERSDEEKSNDTFEVITSDDKKVISAAIKGSINTFLCTLGTLDLIFVLVKGDKRVELPKFEH